MVRFRVFLGAPSAADIDTDPSDYVWQTLQDSSITQHSLAFVPYPPATLDAASRRISLLYQNVIFDSISDSREPELDHVSASQQDDPGTSPHRSTRTREQNHDTAQTEQLSSPGPPLPLQTLPEPPPSSDPPDHSPKEPMTHRKQVPPSTILTPPPSLVFQTSNSAYTRLPPCSPSISPQNRAGDLAESTCFSLPSRFKDPIPSM